MRVTLKGQVTIPQHIRKKLGITPATEIDFVEEDERVYIVTRRNVGNLRHQLSKLRGVATARMTTDEIMALTRR